jgi:Spy/CpxP family protein refolding chaperone
MKIQIALSALLLSFATCISQAALANSLDGGIEIARNSQEADASCSKDQLQLSDEQKENLYNLKNKLQDQLEPKKAELQSHKRKIKDLLTQATIDKGLIKEEQSKILALQTEISNSLTDFKIAFAETLTPEQRKNFRHMRPGKKGHHKRQGFRQQQRSEAPTADTSAST